MPLPPLNRSQQVKLCPSTAHTPATMRKPPRLPAAGRKGARPRPRSHVQAATSLSSRPQPARTPPPVCPAHERHWSHRCCRCPPCECPGPGFRHEIARGNRAKQIRRQRGDNVNDNQHGASLRVQSSKLEVQNLEFWAGRTLTCAPNWRLDAAVTARWEACRNAVAAGIFACQ